MNVAYRRLLPTDIATIRRFMPFSASESTAGIVAYDRDTAEPLALFIAQEWTATSCMVHQIIIRPMVIRHGWFEEIAHYMFETAGRLKLFGLIPSTNARALSMNRKLGFKEIARLADAVDYGEDFVLMELHRDNCPYWNPLPEAANG